jgi:DNA-binding transcriptional MerR regulator
MIDTLKLSKRLQAAHMPSEQADALADGLAESLREDYVTREHFDQGLTVLRSDMNSRIDTLRSDMNSRIDTLRAEMNSRIDTLRADMEGRFRLLYWMLGFNLALTVGVLGRLLVAH